MTFVELSPSILVDPTEVTVVSGDSTGTRVYLKGNGGLSWLDVDRPVHEVLAIVFPATPRADEQTDADGVSA